VSLFAVHNQERDYHDNSDDNDDDPNDRFTFLFVFVNVVKFYHETEVAVRIVGSDIDSIGFSDVIDSQSDVLVDFKLSDIVPVHVSEKQSVQSSGMEGKGHFIGVHNSMNTKNGNKGHLNNLLVNVGIISQDSIIDGGDNPIGLINSHNLPSELIIDIWNSKLGPLPISSDLDIVAQLPRNPLKHPQNLTLLDVIVPVNDQKHLDMVPVGDSEQ
jgi:hypothetical protein